jgi:hypothetical protein
MTPATHPNAAVVPPEEVDRRLAEMRRTFWEHRVAPQVVYQPVHWPCPWPGCDLRIAGIRFELDRMGQPEQMDSWLTSWWQGPGLIARCPGCGRDVLFGIFAKRAVPDPAGAAAPRLPDDWHQRAHLTTRPQNKTA